MIRHHPALPLALRFMLVLLKLDIGPGTALPFALGRHAHIGAGRVLRAVAVMGTLKG